LPEPQATAAAAVPEAVGGDFVDGGHQFGGSRRPQAGGTGVMRDLAAYGYRFVSGEGELRDAGPWLRKRDVEGRGRCFQPAKDVASAPGAGKASDRGVVVHI
jgi:hypothetical protein